MPHSNPNILDESVFQIRTPNGTLYAFIAENPDGTINRFELTIGKAGNDVALWATALAGVMTLAVHKGVTLEELLTELSGITSSSRARAIGSTCRSGPEGVWMALMRYKASKFTELKDKLGINEHDSNYRGPTVAAWARQRD